jgi:signal transduction histidine kinase
MSYRAFKRLIGETSLERKCRYMLGAVIVVVVVTSFAFFARQTESLAYEVTVSSGRLLVPSIVARLHVQDTHRQAILDEFQRDSVVGRLLIPAIVRKLQTEDQARQSAIDEFQRESEERWPKALSNYEYQLIKASTHDPKYKPKSEDLAILKQFQNDDTKYEESLPTHMQGAISYYGAIRATGQCIACHSTPGQVSEPIEHLKEGDLMALARVSLPVNAIETGVNKNRAWLISSAFLTAIGIMFASYRIIKYVIVKPVNHLKEVSDAIAAGELNVRSEIQTADEFEDLSHAFNRMLRNLVSMQDRLKKVNTDLDRKVDELARANLALYESNRLKSDFLATMSHELRTPLNSILGFSEVLQSGNLSDKQTRWVSNIQTSGTQLLNLINDILDLAKIEAGKMQIRLEMFDLAEVNESLVGMFRPLAEKKNIDLRHVHDATLPIVRQDATKLRQILSNLLSNAIKFTPEGGRVKLETERAGDEVILRVHDTGVGIAREDQDLIFEKFRQAANPMTREQGGTGLGLSIVRELAKLLGGDVTLESELGRGSTFTVRLPLALRDESSLAADLTAPAPPAPALAS